jgi:hypothetical protein
MTPISHQRTVTFERAASDDPLVDCVAGIVELSLYNQSAGNDVEPRSCRDVDDAFCATLPASWRVVTLWTHRWAQGGLEATENHISENPDVRFILNKLNFPCAFICFSLKLTGQLSFSA